MGKKFELTGECKTHGGGKHGREYKAIINTIKAKFSLEQELEHKEGNRYVLLFQNAVKGIVRRR